MIKETYLAKGLALGLLDHFQSIHIAKNPYEAIEIVKNRFVETVITDLHFSTIDAEKYIENIANASKNLKSIIVLKDAPIQIQNENYECDIIIKENSISIQNIIQIIQSVKTK